MPPAAWHIPDVKGDKALLSEVEGPKRQRFKRYPIGFHMDIAEVQTAGPQATEGQRKLHVFVGIDRTSKFAIPAGRQG